jgi:hypothetical protein
VGPGTGAAVRLDGPLSIQARLANHSVIPRPSASNAYCVFRISCHLRLVAHVRPTLPAEALVDIGVRPQNGQVLALDRGSTAQG